MARRNQSVPCGDEVFGGRPPLGGGGRGVDDTSYLQQAHLSGMNRLLRRAGWELANAVVRPTTTPNSVTIPLEEYLGLQQDAGAWRHLVWMLQQQQRGPLAGPNVPIPEPFLVPTTTGPAVPVAALAEEQAKVVTDAYEPEQRQEAPHPLAESSKDFQPKPHDAQAPAPPQSPLDPKVPDFVPRKQPLDPVPEEEEEEEKEVEEEEPPKGKWNEHFPFEVPDVEEVEKHAHAVSAPHRVTGHPPSPPPPPVPAAQSSWKTPEVTLSDNKNVLDLAYPVPMKDAAASPSKGKAGQLFDGDVHRYADEVEHMFKAVPGLCTADGELWVRVPRGEEHLPVLQCLVAVGKATSLCKILYQGNQTCCADDLCVIERNLTPKWNEGRRHLKEQAYLVVSFLYHPARGDATKGDWYPATMTIRFKCGTFERALEQLTRVYVRGKEMFGHAPWRLVPRSSVRSAVSMAMQGVEDEFEVPREVRELFGIDLRATSKIRRRSTKQGMQFAEVQHVEEWNFLLKDLRQLVLKRRVKTSNTPRFVFFDKDKSRGGRRRGRW